MIMPADLGGRGLADERVAVLARVLGPGLVRANQQDLTGWVAFRAALEHGWSRFPSRWFRREDISRPAI
jgi:hypothetical protein